MPSDGDSWLEELGVNFETFADDTLSNVAGVTSGDAADSALGLASDVSGVTGGGVVDSALGLVSEVSGVTSNDVADSAPGLANDVLDSEPPLQADVSGGPGDSVSATLIFDGPIGVVPLISATPNDASRLSFTVIVANSDKDPLLFLASANGTIFATVKISLPGGTITLQNVIISSFSVSGSGGQITMTLDSAPPRDKPNRPTASTLDMGAPIGVLPLLSSSQTDSSGRVFDVTVPSSAKDPLLVGFVASGQKFAIVKISRPAGIVTLKTVLISFFSASRSGKELNMTLNAASSSSEE